MQAIEFDAKGKALSKELLEDGVIEDLLREYPLILIHNDRFIEDMEYAHVLDDIEGKGTFPPFQQLWWHRDHEPESWYPFDGIVLHATQRRNSKTVVSDERSAFRNMKAVIDVLDGHVIEPKQEPSVEYLTSFEKRFREQGGYNLSPLWEMLGVGKTLLSQYDSLSELQRRKVLNAVGVAFDRLTWEIPAIGEYWKIISENNPAVEYQEKDTFIFDNTVHGRVTNGEEVIRVKRKLLDYRKLY